MIAVLLCLKRKKSKLFKGYAPTPTRGGGRGEGGGGREEGGRREGGRRERGGGREEEGGGRLTAFLRHPPAM